jgi:fructosamine-3-kinase
VAPAPRLPVEVRAGVEEALARHFGRQTTGLSASPVGGGCISPAARVETAAGDVAFLKWGERKPEAPEGYAVTIPGTPGLFTAEAQSLRVLREAGAVRVPEVIAVWDAGAGTDAVATPWLLLEWLEPASPTRAIWERLGQGLAALHRVRGERYGWPADNFIGPLPQTNAWLDDWAAFWRERRLEPQLRRAYDAGWFEPPARRRFERLLDRLDQLLAPATADGPSLLHGDLWNGNVHPLAGGEPAIIDPASYFGHREVDLAMADLFGGFDPAFYEAYRESWSLAESYESVRRQVYQLYYLLVHVNLFGRGYLARTLRVLEGL